MGETMDDLTIRDLIELIHAIDDALDLAGEDRRRSLTRGRVLITIELGRRIAAIDELNELIAV